LTAAELIAAHQQIANRAHAKGIRVIGGTILPFKGNGAYTDAREAPPSGQRLDPRQRHL
jgi:hypothetical protein